jgi:hypothetical protein
MRHARLLMFVAASLATTTWAVADDVFAPSWRGDANSLTVAWETWGLHQSGPQNPPGYLVQANPNVFTDPFSFSAYYGANVDNVASAYGRNDVLYIHALPGSFPLSFALDNYDTGGERKDMVIQITFLPGENLGSPMDFNIGDIVSPPGSPPWILPINVDAIVSEGMLHSDGWQTNSYKVTYTPNPDAEGIAIEFGTYPAYVDEVVIDTRCIPEPATLVFLGTGVIGLMSCAWRRRKR